MSSAPERYLPETRVNNPGIRLATATEAEESDLYRRQEDRCKQGSLHQRDGNPAVGCPRRHDERNRTKAWDRNGNREATSEASALEAGGAELPSRDSYSAPERVAWNELTESWEQPFPNIDERTRRRAFLITGRSLEESYEGLTRILLAVVHEVSD